jgi:DNA-binding NarL/FixJ family response regulator
MPIEWFIFFAVLCLLLALFIFRDRLRTHQPREREFYGTLIDTPLIIGKTQWDRLTARQQQVARLAARGFSNAEIAHQLDIKPNTVDAHLKKIYGTLDVHSRTELSYKIRSQLD